MGSSEIEGRLEDNKMTDEDFIAMMVDDLTGADQPTDAEFQTRYAMLGPARFQRCMEAARAQVDDDAR